MEWRLPRGDIKFQEALLTLGSEWHSKCSYNWSKCLANVQLMASMQILCERVWEMSFAGWKTFRSLDYSNSLFLTLATHFPLRTESRHHQTYIFKTSIPVISMCFLWKTVYHDAEHNEWLLIVTKWNFLYCFFNLPALHSCNVWH